jgi:O-antigen ligase
MRNLIRYLLNRYPLLKVLDRLCYFGACIVTFLAGFIALTCGVAELREVYHSLPFTPTVWSLIMIVIGASVVIVGFNSTRQQLSLLSKGPESFLACVCVVPEDT